MTDTPDSQKHETVARSAPATPQDLGRVPAVTRRFGRYVLEAELGRGGMGIVYRAIDEELRRPVALKIVKHELADDLSVIARFVAEAEITAQLQHPSIVPIFDLGRTPAGDTFYTMRLVTGLTFDALAGDRFPDPQAWVPGPDGGRWPLARVLQAFVQVCRAVSYAHDRSVVHRDLKPSNIMVGRFGEVHVMDWGLAKLVGEKQDPARGDREIVHSGRAETLDFVMGTPSYMAPEQALGLPVAPSFDVYALGGVLYTLLTGHATREGSPTEILASLVGLEPAVPPKRREPAVPDDLDAICRRALEPDPASRTPSVEALAREVEGFLEGRPLVSPRPEDAAFLATYRPSDDHRPTVAVDIVLFCARPGTPVKVVLMRRSRHPFEGCWALPGRFIRLEESLDDAARSLLVDETGIDTHLPLEQIAAFGDPRRDPRMRVISVAYWAAIPWSPSPVAPASQAHEIHWFVIERRPDKRLAFRRETTSPDDPPDIFDLAFDHERIVVAALDRLAAAKSL